MEYTNAVNCLICKKTETSYYISTNALMHEPNNELYAFNVCNNCETVFLTNPVMPERLEDYYTENYLPYRGSLAWGKYFSFVVNSQKNLDLKRVNFVKKYLKKNDLNFNILDVGCGNPSFLELLQQDSKVNCTGIDFSDSGWKGKNYPKLELKKVSIEDYNTKTEFDVITLWHYLEHDYNPHQTIETLYNCLKQGGKIIIEIPDYKSISAKIQKSYWQGWHSPRHLSLLTNKGFALLFPKDKWEIKKHLRYGTLDAFTLWWLGRMEKKGIDWSGNMSNHFWMLVLLKVITSPIFVFEKLFPLGVQILVVEKK
ncbi:class I SAM-dependent methyltransferase [Flavobacterium sp. LS2P90]|uniref:Class I SAM-dependent methyltransferase n=1 Tax=Flavobacterium xylosi TaxID=3230415 RepID=A0ABW6HSH1_9FLAO